MQVSPDRFRPENRALLTDPESILLLSAASSWEIGIKWATGKLLLPEEPETYVPRRLERQGVSGLAIEHRHALHAAALPPHHRDPFDRLLIAQAELEELVLLTADRQLEPYSGIELLWA
jgi:PIN domain nuclease of toxin-antitoxin system